MSKLEIANQRIAKLQTALENLKQYMVCNCEPNERSGRVTYHHNCNRHAMKIITEALHE